MSQLDPIDVAAEKAAASAQQQQSRHSRKKQRRQQRIDDDERRLPRAAQLSDDGRTLTIHHYPMWSFLISPFGIFIGLLAAAATAGLILLFQTSMPPLLLWPTRALLGSVVVAVAWYDWRWIRRSPLVMRITESGNVVFFRRGRPMAAYELSIEIVRYGRRWGAIRWAGKCELIAWGQPVKKGGRSYIGNMLFNRRVFGVTRADIETIKRFCRDNDKARVSHKDYSTTHNYEDRSFWA
jgi:hypothetical protein